MAGGKYNKKNAKKLIEALRKCLGIKSQAAAMCGYERHIIDRWAKKHEDFAKQVEEVIEVQKDFVEAKFLQLIRDGDASCIIHYMKTKCKDRGYGKNVDITTNGRPLDLKFEIVEDGESEQDITQE